MIVRYRNCSNETKWPNRGNGIDFSFSIVLDNYAVQDLSLYGGEYEDDNVFWIATPCRLV